MCCDDDTDNSDHVNRHVCDVTMTACDNDRYSKRYEHNTYSNEAEDNLLVITNHEHETPEDYLFMITNHDSYDFLP